MSQGRASRTIPSVGALVGVFVGSRVFVGAIVLVPHVAQSYPDVDAEQLAVVLKMRVITPLRVIVAEPL